MSKKEILHGQKQKQPPQVFYKTCILKNFVEFTRKHMCRSLLFNKAANLSKRDSNFSKNKCFFLWILRNFYEHDFYRTRLGYCFYVNRDTARQQWIVSKIILNPAGIHLLKVNNRNTRGRHSDVFIVNFEHISNLVLLFLLLTLNM